MQYYQRQSVGLNYIFIIKINSTSRLQSNGFPRFHVQIKMSTSVEISVRKKKSFQKSYVRLLFCHYTLQFYSSVGVSISPNI